MRSGSPCWSTPLTAAERRLYDAKYRLDTARTGVYPQSIGVNATDKVSRVRKPTATELATFEKAYQNELAKLPNAPESVRRLVSLLGVL